MRLFRKLPVVGSLLAGSALAALVFFGLGSNDARAKSAYDSAYGYDRTWNAGTRLVRVDMGFKLTEKDESAGYLLFDYRSPESGNKAVPGSMEFVRAKDTGAVRVIVQIPQMPGYHEQVLIDALQRKMRAEYGDPPKRPPPPSPPRDAGADGEAF